MQKKGLILFLANISSATCSRQALVTGGNMVDDDVAGFDNYLLYDYYIDSEEKIC